MKSVPQPTPFDAKPPAPGETAHVPTLGPLNVVAFNGDGQEEVAFIYKRTYVIHSQGSCELAEDQVALYRDAVLHEPIAEGITPSYKFLPELIGLKNGTDFVLKASAFPNKPTGHMQVSLEVGQYRQTAMVYGPRVCDYINGNLVFSPPQPFDEMPLRYENAYGGGDPHYEKILLETTKDSVSQESWRKIQAPAEEFLKGSAPFPVRYPRNSYGKGYVIDENREAIEGKELPNLERPNDLLTPERLIVGNPYAWPKQPLPIGFDFLPPSLFPRSALFAMPPAFAGEKEDLIERKMGLVPPDFMRGNILTCKPEDIPQLIHPLVGRNASLGLWLPFLQGNEQVSLSGMSPQNPQSVISLPGERPFFVLKGSRKDQEINSNLTLVYLDMEARQLQMTWVGRFLAPQPLLPDHLEAFAAEVKIGIRKVT